MSNHLSTKPRQDYHTSPRKIGAVCSATIWMRNRIASSDLLLIINLLPHLICSRLILFSGGGYEAGEHGDT